LPRVALVTDAVTVGGATTFLCNLGGELVRRGIPVEVHGLETENPLGSDFAALQIPVRCQQERLIHEDRLAVVLKRLREFKPTVVLANLGQVSFEILRYMPAGVLRVAVAHADQPGVYQALRPYAGEMDLLGAVSETIRSKFAQLPEFANVPVRYLP